LPGLIQVEYVVPKFFTRYTRQTNPFAKSDSYIAIWL